MATAKSHVDGGQRSAKRHAGELTGGAAMALLLVSLLPEGMLDAFQGNLASVVMTGAFSQASKLASNGGFMNLLKRLGAVSLLVVMVSGCGVSMGRVTPHEFTGHNGETIIACTIEGVQFGLFDGGVCRNVEGGQVGQTFVDLFTGTVEAVGRIVGGLLMGLGGAGAAIVPADDA